MSKGLPIVRAYEDLRSDMERWVNEGHALTPEFLFSTAGIEGSSHHPGNPLHSLLTLIADHTQEQLKKSPLNENNPYFVSYTSTMLGILLGIRFERLIQKERSDA